MAEILLPGAMLTASLIGSVEVTLGRTPVNSSFLLQPVKKTISSNAMTGNTFTSFILLSFI
jgi:hypothetical protein